MMSSNALNFYRPINIILDISIKLPIILLKMCAKHCTSDVVYALNSVILMHIIIIFIYIRNFDV